MKAKSYKLKYVPTVQQLRDAGFRPGGAWIHAEAFMFAGIGGEEAEKYAREKFRERFSIDSMDDNTRYEVMHLLDEYLDIPHCAKVKDEEEFRRQAEQRYRDMEKD